MLPIRDSQPSRRFPFVTIVLIVVNVLVFLHQVRLPALALMAFYEKYAFTPAGLSASIESGRFYPPVLTSMFLHGDWGHLLGNMWSLWLFGDNVEDYLRPFRFILFYLLTGLAAIAAHTLAYPGSTTVTLGASGAIAGVMGAYLVLYPHARIRTLIPVLPYIIDVPAFVYLIIWFVLQVIGVASRQAAGIAWWAHIAGFAVGLLLCVRGRNRHRRRASRA